MGTTSFTGVYNGELSDAGQLNQFIAPINNLEQAKPYWGGTSTGSANAQVVATIPVTSAIAAGQILNWIPGYANTGAATLNVGTGPSPILRGGAALSAGALVVGAAISTVYDGTSWHLLGAASGGGGGGGGTPGVIGARWFMGDISGVIALDYDNSPGQAFTVVGTTASLGQAWPGGYVSPGFVIPTGCTYILAMAEVAVMAYTGTGLGYIEPRIARYQSGLSAPLVPGSSSYLGLGQNQHSGRVGVPTIPNLGIQVSAQLQVTAGDMIVCDLETYSGITQAGIYSFSILGFGSF